MTRGCWFWFVVSLFVVVLKPHGDKFSIAVLMKIAHPLEMDESVFLVVDDFAHPKR